MAKMLSFIVFFLFLHGILGELVCEELLVGECSFSVASSGYRCLLETFESTDGAVSYQCKTSRVTANRMDEHIESDECVSACGVDKSSAGISSDALLDTHFTTQLCSPQCYQNCPNIVDLYYNLALAEGVFLPDLCKAQRLNARRSMFQLLSSGAAAAASGPISSASAPSPSSVDCAPPPM
ncbi:hypothetical protein F511_17551 [Dorcoceras hygrometricum]|uniref:PAR1 protein n=1 Tax=Dorcoceras hygrometricum TaxID=472368 RepID=A0A2Z7BDC4_9LAMI|nr:hypothetical protein F511_17551 [Dorcoceras hygrometricum]